MKTMLVRLKGQLEEMRARLQLLGLVQKYLQASGAGAALPLTTALPPGLCVLDVLTTALLILTIVLSHADCSLPSH